jgi:hypothetical protein
MVDPAAAAFTAKGVCRAGVPVTIVRLIGSAPNVTTVSTDVIAIVRNVIADTQEQAQTNYSASKPGAITQDDRLVILMASDLAAAGFPLPVIKGDRVVLDPTTLETVEVTKADRFKRAFAGAIELTVTGVS